MGAIDEKKKKEQKKQSDCRIKNKNKTFNEETEKTLVDENSNKVKRNNNKKKRLCCDDYSDDGNNNNSKEREKERCKIDEDFDIEQGSRGRGKCRNKAVVTVITDLDVYKGTTLEEKIDSFIHSHDVVMINRTWCLFSVDACDFLVNQLNVNVFSLEVDQHSDGKKILNYVSSITNHSSTPIIFIQGSFLGGFEDVNALYAQGKLHNEYLGNLTQADQCEKFVSTFANERMPLLWFPKTVNGHIIRIMGCITSLLSIISAIGVHFINTRGGEYDDDNLDESTYPYYSQWDIQYSWSKYIAYLLAIDFTLRIFGGAKWSIIGRFVIILASKHCLRIGSNNRSGRPKQFACLCGFMFSTSASILYMIPNNNATTIAGSIIIAMLAIASGMEGILDFCLGCLFFKWGVKFGIIPK